MTSRKVIDIANSLEFVNDYNNSGITGNNSRISTSEYGQLFLYSTTPSVNSSTATVVLYNGGLSINCTTDTTNLTSGGSLTVRGGASFEKSIRVGDSGYITNVISTNSSTSSLNVSGLTAGNINFTGDLYQNGSLYVSSQWSSSGGNLFIPATNGNVGIATVSPAYTLDVNGTVNSNNMISTNITTSVLNATGITSGNINFTGNLYKNGSIYISSQWNDEAGGALSFTGGNVGIGNTSPNYKLDITGNLRVNATVASVITSQNNSNVLQIQNKLISGNSSLEFADNSGNTKLFTGYANASSSLVSLAGSAYILSDTAVSLKLVAGNRTSSPVILNANDNSVSITTTTDATDIYSGALKVSGGAGIANQLYVGDDLHVNRDLYVNGSINGAAASSSTFAYLTLTATDDAINLSTGSLVTFGGITIQSTTDSNSLTDGGSFLTAGGASIQKTLRVGTGIITENISSTNISSTNISTNSINVSSITSTMLTTGNIVANNLNLGISNIYSGSFAFSNNTNVPANVNGLSGTDTRSFTVNLSVSIESSGGNLHETFILDANQTESQWYLYTTGYGDDSGIVFSITNLGQIQYTSTNISGFTNGIFRFFVNQISNTGNYTYAGSQTQGTLITNTIQILSTVDSNIGINNGSLYLAGGATVSKTLYAENITSGNAKFTNITTSTARITTGITTGSINANDGTITNCTITNGTIANGTITNGIITNGTITNGTITNGIITNVSAGTLSASTITGGNLSLSGNLIVGGTLTTVNITSTNILNTAISVGTIVATGLSSLQNVTATNISAGTINVTYITTASAQITNANITTSTIATARITSNLVSLGNSNTVGNIFTTGGNVGINTVSPGSSLHVAGSIPVSPIGNGIHLGIDPATYAAIQLNSTAGNYIDFGTSGGDYQSRIIAGNTGNLSISTNGASNNGYVGINTVSPSYTLDVTGTGRFTSKLTITGSAGTTGFDTATSDQYADMRVIRNSSSSIDKDMYLQLGAGGTSTLHMFSNNSETMTLKSGNVGISTTAPSGMLHLNNAALFTSTGNLTCTGDIISFGSLSDRRLKKNIETIETLKALEIVSRLRAVTFNWREDIFNEEKRNTSDIGFIAQEVEALVPEAVSEYTQIESGEVYKNIKHERLVPYLLSAIQYLLSKQS